MQTRVRTKTRRTLVVVALSSHKKKLIATTSVVQALTNDAPKDDNDAHYSLDELCMQDLINRRTLRLEWKRTGLLVVRRDRLGICSRSKREEQLHL